MPEEDILKCVYSSMLPVGNKAIPKLYLEVKKKKKKLVVVIAFCLPKIFQIFM